MLSRVLVPLVLVTGALGERANLCFTAHGKTSLQCTRTLLEGPIDVYDDTESPQKARKLHYKNGQLCDGRGCKKCMSTGGAWVACGRATRMPVSVARANGDSNRAPAVLIALAVVAVPVVVFSLGGKLQRSKPTTSTASVKGGGAAGAVVDFLLRFAGAWWFPLVAAMGTAINMFTIIFTAATVVLFLSAILGRPRSWYMSAFANAAGATLGTAVLLLLVRERGLSYLNETFPTVLASPAWAKATALMTTYGVGGMFLVSCMPIILHPVIAFGMLSGMSNSTILGIVMGGRTVKYLIMGYVTVNVPSALRFFGIKGSLVEYATNATAANAGR